VKPRGYTASSTHRRLCAQLAASQRSEAWWSLAGRAPRSRRGCAPCRTSHSS
jgi:hypothetical protein